MNIRYPVVAGRFYPGTVQELTEYLQTAVPAGQPKVKALGVVSPHAGYIYSGGVAGKVLGAVEVTETVLLLGPNHTGNGHKAAIQSAGYWATPLGKVPIDADLANALKRNAPLLAEDTAAHELEHSLEVQLPFLQYIRPNVKIVPIAFMLRSLDEIETVGRAIGQTLKHWPKPVLMVASSDMTHYESAHAAKIKDELALAEVLALDPKGLLDVVGRNHITMCGVIPTAVLLYAAREMGATEARRVAYANSGEVTKDFQSVVGYAGVMVL